MNKAKRIIFDSNIWISFAIGKRLNELKIAFSHPKVEVFVCQKLLVEVSETIQKPKFAKYISTERKEMLFDIIKACHWVNIEEQISLSRDPKDDFLLDLARTINADFLITGDDDLLVIKNYHHTNIISFNSFMAFMDTIDLLPSV